MTEAPGGAARTYVLRDNQRERRRLILQASILNPLTERFLRSCGISRGMRILDLGCGAGDVSMIAAALTGPGGEVVGIDLSPGSLELARERAGDAHLHNVRFECGDLMEYHPESPFDAVIGRHVLLHLADAPGAIRRLSSFLTRGGIAAFQEYDLSSWRTGYPEPPLAAALAGSMVDLFRRATPCADVGVRLYHLLSEAGFCDVQGAGECLMDGGSDSLYYEWFAETVLSLSPKMRALGIAVDIGDEEMLASRLAHEFTRARACICSPLIVSAWGTNGTTGFRESAQAR